MLGHAFYPLPHRAQVEIHLDFEQKWYHKNDSNLASDEVSLLSVLTHEIGQVGARAFEGIILQLCSHSTH